MKIEKGEAVVFNISGEISQLIKGLDRIQLHNKKRRQIHRNKRGEINRQRRKRQ